MLLLAVESSGLVASVALLSDDVLIGEFTTNFKKTHSQTLLPMLDQMIRMVGADLKDVDAIAVSKGPGSFTGLRIGAATAKGLGLALDKPLIGVPTVDAIAYNLFGTEKLICPLMDARRDQVYTGLYTFESGAFQVVRPQEAVSIGAVVERLDEMGRPVIFLGDGVPVYKDYIEEHMRTEHEYAPPHLSRQRAGALAVLGKRYLEEGRAVRGADLMPEYLRLSQAERERLEREKQRQAEDPAESGGAL